MMRKWRTQDGKSIVGTFVASNLSLSIIFPEDTLVKGVFSIHIFEDDMWLYEMIISVFALLLISIISIMLCCVLCLSVLRCMIHCSGGEVPRCLRKWIKPIPRDYRFYCRNKYIREIGYSHDRVSFNQDKCSICLELFERGGDVSGLGCEHVYHIECIKGWIDRKTQKSQLCPVCNIEIYNKKYDNKKVGVSNNET